jgi:hypothetical protein
MLHVVKVEVESAVACAIIQSSPQEMLIASTAHVMTFIAASARCSAYPHIKARHGETVLITMSIH